MDGTLTSGLQKNTIYTILTQIPNFLLGFASGIFLSVLMGPHGKGVFSYLHVNIDFLALILSVGTTTGIGFFISNKRISEKAIIGISLWVIIISSIIVTGILILLYLTQHDSAFFVAGYSDLFYYLYFIISFSLPISVSFIVSYFRSKGQFKIVNSGIVLNSILTTTTFGILWFLHKQQGTVFSLKTLLIVILLAKICNFLYYVYFYLTKIKAIPTLVIKKTVFILFFSFVFIGFFGELVNFFNYRVNIWFITYHCNVEDLGFYTLAYNFGQMFQIFTNAMVAVLFPYFSSSNLEKARSTLKIFSRINTFILVLLGLFLVIIASWFIPFLYGKAFLGSVTPFRFIIPGFVFLCMAILMGNYIAAKDKIIVNSIINVVALIATVICNVLLIPKYGIQGAAIATSVSFFFIFILTTIYLIVKADFRLDELFVLKKGDLKYFINIKQNQ